MKNILLVLSYLLLAGMTFGQVKVTTNGFTKIGDTGVAPTSQLHVKAVSGTAFGTELFKVEDTDGFFNVSEGASGTGVFVPAFKFQGAGLSGGAAGISAALPAASDALNSVPYVAAMMLDTRTVSNSPLSSARTFSIRNFITPQLTILANGNVGIGSTMANPVVKLQVDGSIMATGSITPSDKKLKKNIKSLNYGLKELLKLNTKQYSYNGKAGISDQSLTMGLIAQEVQEVLPELVKEYEHITYKNEDLLTDDPSFIPEDFEVIKETFLAINESSLKFVMINAIQEQQQLIDDQNERISNLESAIERLLENTQDAIGVELEGSNTATIAQNTPNPFSGNTSISYFLPEDVKSAQVNIFDISGKLLKTVQIDETGKGEINVNALGIASGTYSYSLIIDNRLVDTKKMVLAK